MDNKEIYYKVPGSITSDEKTVIFIDEDTITLEDFEEGDTFDEC